MIYSPLILQPDWSEVTSHGTIHDISFLQTDMQSPPPTTQRENFSLVMMMVAMDIMHSTINPLRMRKRVTVVRLFVCMSVFYHSNCLSADLCCPTVVLTELHVARYLKGF